MEKSQPILEVKNLHKVFNQDLFKSRNVAIKNLSCRFLQGQCTALMGHNGAGKTTTIRTIFGFIHPTQGEILFNGKPIATSDRARIGYMPETNKLPQTLTPVECLSTQLKLLKPGGIPGQERARLVEGALQGVGLWGHQHKKIGQLSKGMGRRLAYAMATIHHPELIILDEPFSGLDPLGRQHIISLIHDLKARGTSIILCTHELWSLGNLCDQLHIMNKGELVFSTLDPSKAGDPQPKRQFYELMISGASESQLNSLRSSHHLPPWSHWESEGFLTQLHFDAYGDATAWFQTCMTQGLVITKFDLRSSWDEKSLVTYFDGGNN